MRCVAAACSASLSRGFLVFLRLPRIGWLGFRSCLVECGQKQRFVGVSWVYCKAKQGLVGTDVALLCEFLPSPKREWVVPLLSLQSRFLQQDKGYAILCPS